MRVRLVRPAPPAAVTEIARRLASSGRASWLAGESLADLLRDRAPARVTLETSAPASEIAGLFDRAVPTAPGGRVFQLPTPTGPVDLLPVAADSPGEQLLRRRGLTVLAMAWSPLDGELSDPCGGHDDLSHGVLRLVDPASDLLARRPGLALDVARLRAQHADEPDAELEKALARLGHDDLERVPAAARGRNLLAMIEAPHAGDAVALLARTGLERALGLRSRADAPALLDAAPGDPAVRLVVWLRGNRPGRFVRRHRIARELSERVIALLAAHPVDESFTLRRRSSIQRLAALDPADREALFWLRTQELERSADQSVQEAGRRALEGLRSALDDHFAEEALRRDARPLALDGRDVMQALGVLQGPLVGRALQHLQSRVAVDPALNEPEALRALLREWSKAEGAAAGAGDDRPAARPGAGDED